VREKNLPEDDGWYCPYCGYHNPENDRFCFECERKREKEYNEEEKEPVSNKNKRIVPY